MKIFLNRKNFYVFILIYSLLSIFFALYVEHVLQYKPCKLCLYQRVPFLIAVFISFIGFNYFRNDNILILIIVIFSLNLIISGYHFGIENNIFEEFSGCSNNSLGITNKLELLKSLNNNTISCKEVDFRLFGISMAGMNFFLTILLIIYSIRILVYEKN
tara:strand:- start:3889 stop:4365 length:477 start_codon:yes stop_codon:yes gene_type:complete